MITLILCAISIVLAFLAAYIPNKWFVIVAIILADIVLILQTNLL